MRYNANGAFFYEIISKCSFWKEKKVSVRTNTIEKKIIRVADSCELFLSEPPQSCNNTDYHYEYNEP